MFRFPALPLRNPRCRPWYGTYSFWNHPIKFSYMPSKILQSLRRDSFWWVNNCSQKWHPPPPLVLVHGLGTMCVRQEESCQLDSLGSNSPPHPGNVQIPNPWDGFSCQVPYSPGTENSQMARVCPQEVGGYVDGSNWLVYNASVSSSSAHPGYWWGIFTHCPSLWQLCDFWLTALSLPLRSSLAKTMVYY